MWEQKKEDKPVCVKHCSLADEEELIYLDYYVMAKINYLMKKYQNLEWLAYLIGHDNIVEDFYIPKQQVTGSNVTDIEGDPTIQIMGVIHSHHHMGLHSFSGTDHAYINDNHDLSILVWHGGMNGQKRVKLPCGSTMIVPIRVAFYHPDLNEAELEKEAADNISEKTYNYTYQKGHTPGYGYRPAPAEGGVYLPPATEGKVYNNVTPLTAAEKKTESSESNYGDRNAATGKRDFLYEDYLDQLVYDCESVQETCAEDFPLSDEEVEAHFERIESRECGIHPKVPRHLDDGGNVKVTVGMWEV